MYTRLIIDNKGNKINLNVVSQNNCKNIKLTGHFIRLINRIQVKLQYCLNYCIYLKLL